MGKKIPPFWQQPNRFFLYPFQQEIMLYSLVMAVLSLIPFVSIFALLGIARYGFKIAALASLGVFRLEDHDTRDEEDDWKNLPWKFVGVIFLQFLALIFVIFSFPKQADILVPVGLLLMAVLMPAVVIILIQKLSLWAALNPIEIVRTVTAVGWSYVLLFVFTYLLFQGRMLVSDWLEQSEVLPQWLGIIVLTLVFTYFLFVNMAMIGYTMYQYHKTLDFDVIHDYEENQPQPTSPREIARQRDAEVAELIQNGATEEALLQAQDWLEEAPESLSEHRRYHRVLRLAGAPETLQKHGCTYITLLLKQQAVSEALKVYKNCVAKVPEFTVPSAVTTVSLAKTAFKQQEHDLALKMLRGFDKRFVDHPLIPTAFALIVRVLQEGLHQPKQAQAVFAGLQRLYPNDPHTQEVARILQKT